MARPPTRPSPRPDSGPSTGHQPGFGPVDNAQGAAGHARLDFGSGHSTRQPIQLPLGCCSRELLLERGHAHGRAGRTGRNNSREHNPSALPEVDAGDPARFAGRGRGFGAPAKAAGQAPASCAAGQAPASCAAGQAPARRRPGAGWAGGRRLRVAAIPGIAAAGAFELAGGRVVHGRAAPLAMNRGLRIVARIVVRPVDHASTAALRPPRGGAAALRHSRPSRRASVRARKYAATLGLA
jgi:hypothetical protein